MKLYEAMLKGAKMKPQCFGSAFKDGGSCALGAALDGIGGNIFTRLSGLFSSFGSVQNAPCPVCKLSSLEREAIKLHPGLIPHLNDQHKWSRECIALWIRDNFEKETQIKTEIVKTKEKQSCLSV